ncbi:DNA topoisomerase II, B subunit (plasmid) [Deferribacter desulfuricans SSM1]|uniref:DNA topoisomerase (ATP-hydrolyzing) n=1 Tax=Deferribacter desulfuricans (strain DSM 14783 / JCM 11476 / NBRC 101012 / SSM1) TaxID=639282 RepID=D3PF22_DEFDS|nr:DNA gyrase subunit B [Deferribacter desulfuricans]BAI81814.1 DNA topoisomerase II, B subunit [Deferribacter desulfuricans SSM1]
MSQKTYTEKDIIVLKGLEPVRKRPGMYIGSTDNKGLHHLLWEVVDNSIDEATAGYCSEIEITLHKDYSVTVKDNGRGIPVGPHPELKISTLEVVLTTLHAGGKFENKIYKASGGLHGVGISVVNALSEYLEVYVKRNGNLYYQTYSKGQKQQELQILKTGLNPNDTGTTIHFLPDKTIFKTTKFQPTIIEQRLQELSYLNKGLKIIFINELEEKPKTIVFLSEKGLEEMFSVKTKNFTYLFNPIYIEDKNKEHDLQITCIFGFLQNYYDQTIYSYVNNIPTHEHGTHVDGFKNALSKIFNKYKNTLKLNGKYKITSEDIREGLYSIISVKVINPEFEGQTKNKLGNKEVKEIVSNIIVEHLEKYFDINQQAFKLWYQKTLNTVQAREAARKAKETVRRKNVFETSTLPGKLADCSSKNVEKTELFIVEGDSAGGSAKQSRNKEFQAVLPLKGKIINVEKAYLVKLLENEEVKNLITAIGVNVDKKGKFYVDNLRYGKIIIMTDADVDGAHITTLLLTFFYKYLPEIITQGKLFIAQPPLYKIRYKNKDYYIKDDYELEQFKKINKINSLEQENVQIQRFKGLGEMNPEQLWETTMNPNTRNLIQVEISDFEAANNIFSILMGKNIKERKEFIENYATYANIDM